MSEAKEQLQRLEALSSPWATLLSPLARRVAFPRGIPFQAGQAKAATHNATIGQVTNGRGSPFPAPSLAATVHGLDAKTTFLYSPQPGHKALREAWLGWQKRRAGDPQVVTTLPFATHGLTHALSLISDLFADDATTLVLPTPHWGNYRLLFQMRNGVRVAGYPFFDGDTFNLAGLLATLEAIPGKAVVVLNFPANPTGWMPTEEEAQRIAQALAAREHPTVFVVDDAYQGVVHEADRLQHSIFWLLAQAAEHTAHIVAKVDGATKELLFFPSRIGFLTFAHTQGEVAAIVENKLNALVRGTIGGPAGPSQAMMLHALSDPDTLAHELAQTQSLLRSRWQALHSGLAEIAGPLLRPLPFNAAYFALVEVGGGISAEALRMHLLQHYSVGVIALSEPNAIRIAYCSLAEENIPQLIDALVGAMNDLRQ